MSGHSKWSTIKHKKGAADAKRGKVFSKIVKEITVAARSGGGDLDSNPRLRMIVQKARDNNMPADNIDRAIKKGTGELPGTHYEEMLYEGYGPGGIAILIETLSDNKNRTSSEVRSSLDKNGGNMASPGAVSYLFSKQGQVLIAKDVVEEDKLMDIALNAGASDMVSDGDCYEIKTEPKDFETVQKAISEAQIEYISAEVTMIPSTEVKLSGSDAKKAMQLVEILEDLDDVQNVHSNFDISDEEIPN